jgi:hypothetical protein
MSVFPDDGVTRGADGIKRYTGLPDNLVRMPRVVHRAVARM